MVGRSVAHRHASYYAYMSIRQDTGETVRVCLGALSSLFDPGAIVTILIHTGLKSTIYDLILCAINTVRFKRSDQ